jgi:RimJ/RimL family protein N-acetyltransferase
MPEARQPLSGVQQTGMAAELPTPAERLPADVLARRDALPLKPAVTTLTGRHVRLEPLDLANDLEGLFAVSNGEPFTLGDRRVEAYDPEARIWRYMAAGPFATSGALGAWLRTQEAASDGRPFVVRDVATGTPLGVANLIANQPKHLKIELGSIWYGAIAQGSGASREATGLLLAYVFGLGYRRAEWKCDARNEASRRAALSYGFTFEGIQAAHYIIKDRNRDTAWYRMLDHEWAASSSFAGRTM